MKLESWLKWCKVGHVREGRKAKDLYVNENQEVTHEHRRKKNKKRFGLISHLSSVLQ